MTSSKAYAAKSGEQEIANLIAEYAFRNDDADIGGLGDLFAQAVFTLDGIAARGKTEVEALASAMIPVQSDGYAATSHEITNVSIDVNQASGTATARSYWTVYQAVSGTPRQAILAGRYADEFELREGNWCFTKRDATSRWKAEL
jgi:hypothetical protein